MIDITLLLILLLLSALFSGSETALVSLTIARVESLLEEDRSGAHALYELKKDPSKMLITILIGNNLVNIASSAYATVLATRYFGDIGPGIAVGVLTIVILMFGEIAPKSLATRYAERISLAIAPLMLMFMKLFYPFVWAFALFTTWIHTRSGKQADPTVTEQEIIKLLRHGVQEGSIEQDEREIIKRVFDFGELLVEDVMTPRHQIFALNGELTVRDAMPEILAGLYSRIAVYENNDVDNLRRIIHLRDILEQVNLGSQEKQLKELGTEALFVPASQTLNELFTILRVKQRQIAIAVDEHGGVEGIVTVEDLMEELMGEIYDEIDDAEDMIKKISRNEILSSGDVELRNIEHAFSIELPGKPTDTISWWILEQLSRIPEAGESFTLDTLNVTIKKANERQIQQVLLVKKSNTSPTSKKS